MTEYDFDKCALLIEELKMRSEKKSDIIVAIDGFDGCGKSNLAYRIGYEVLACVLNFDLFLSQSSEGYVSGLDLSRLLSYIKHARDRKVPVVVEGCCMLEVLRKLDISCDTLIYCKEISEGTRIWHDGDCWENAEFYEGKKKQKPAGLKGEIFDYHENYRPWQKAEFIYNLINQRKGIL